MTDVKIRVTATPLWVMVLAVTNELEDQRLLASLGPEQREDELKRRAEELERRQRQSAESGNWFDRQLYRRVYGDARRPLSD